MVADPGLAAMVEHHAVLYADLQDPVALLRGENRPDGLARYWAYAKADRPSGLAAEQVASYTALMAASQPMIAEEVLHAYPMRRHRRLLDVGGGDGSFAALAAARAPALDVVLFDLPPVADRAPRPVCRRRAGRPRHRMGRRFPGRPAPARRRPRDPRAGHP